MKTRVITLLLAAGLLVVAGLTALSIPAAAQTQTVYVRLADGSVVPVQVDAARRAIALRRGAMQQYIDGALVTIQPAGFGGMPSAGQRWSATASASWSAVSARSKSAKRPMSAASAPGVR